MTTHVHPSKSLEAIEMGKPAKGIKYLEKKRDAYIMRLSADGHTQEEIRARLESVAEFEQVKTDVRTIRTVVEYYMTRKTRSAELTGDILREQELERLSVIEAIAMEQAQGGSSGALDTLRRVSESRAKLLGLNITKPIEVELSAQITTGPPKVSDLLHIVVDTLEASGYAYLTDKGRAILEAAAKAEKG